jgi:archaellum component FlaG (FlaF/FlaG flagellin family)
MDKIITTVLLIIISMLMAMSLFSTAYPAVLQGSDAIANMADRAEDKLKSEITIIHSVGELDATGNWSDTNGDGRFNVFVWVKNTGSTRLQEVQYLDVFFGPEGNFTRVPNESTANGTFPRWVGQIENGADWNPSYTLRMTLNFALPLNPGRYFIRVNLANGISADAVLEI